MAGNITEQYSLGMEYYILPPCRIISGSYYLSSTYPPHPDSDIKRPGLTPGKLLGDFLLTFVTFFQKKNLGLMFFSSSPIGWENHS